MDLSKAVIGFVVPIYGTLVVLFVLLKQISKYL